MVWGRSRIVNAKITVGLSWRMPRRHGDYRTMNGIEAQRGDEDREEGGGRGGGGRRGAREGEKGKRAKERGRWC